MSQHAASAMPDDSTTAGSVDLSSITDSFYPHSKRDEEAFELSAEPDEVILYGRTRETNILMEAFSQLCSNYQPRRVTKVIVHGDAGSGKTSLVDLLRKPVFDSDGFFVSGKYFQNTAVQESNSAIMAALSDLCDLLIQSPVFMDKELNRFQKKLGLENGRLLKKCISNLSPLLDKSTGDHCGGDDVPIRNVAAYTKFKIAFKAFLQAVSCKQHPIVLFIDDIQWMDNDSAKLVELLINDHELSNIMIILAYRDEESASLDNMLNQMKSREDVVDIAVQNLDAGGVHELISSIIGSSTAAMTELSHIVATKTMGNPYYVMELLEFIQMEGLLVYNADTVSWQFDADEIQREVMVSNTLAELLTRKVQSLPSWVQENLKIASLIGFRFTDELLVRAMSSFLDQTMQDESDERVHSCDGISNQTAAAICEAVYGGFVERTKHGYQFSHDTIQTAFQSKIGQEEKERMHMAIGETLLAIGDAESSYRASLHLFNAPHFVRDDETRIKLARLHLEAALYCKEKSAFLDAASALYRGLGTLDPLRKWTDFFDVTFDLTENLARVELIVGNYESCTDMTSETLRRAKTMKMRINALMIGVECVMAQNDVEASIAAANRALCSLGIVMPWKVSFRQIGSKLLKVKLLLRRKSDQDILGLPFMRDETATATSRILVNLCTYCFLKDETSLGVYSALLAIEMTLKGGLNPYSACALAIYGVAQLSSGNHRGAYRFGKLALALQNQVKAKDAECATTVLSLTLLTHWYEPVRGMTSTLRQAVKAGFEVGDVVYGTYSLAMFYGAQTMIGINLEQLEASMRADARSICDLSHDAMGMWTQPVFQYVLNLRNDEPSSWLELTVLSGESMDETTFIRRALASNHQILVMMTLNYKALLACSFGFWSMAESIYVDLISMGKTFYFSFAAMSNSLFGGIASYSCYEQNGKRKHLKLARKNRTRLVRAASRGCPNATAYLSFLEAEDLAVRKSSRPHDVSAAYKTAIGMLVSEGFPHTEAYARERAGFFHAKVGNREEAASCFRRALELYRDDWGAIARHDWLMEKSEVALRRMKVTEKTRRIIDSIVNIREKEDHL